MKYFLCLIIQFSFILSIHSQQVDINEPKAYISINATIGRHQVNFKGFNKSPGISFGFNVNIGIYAVRNRDYSGGLQFTLIEGASYNKDRRRLSEEFDIPYKSFDKHIIFKFAQFRSANIGWFSQLKISDEVYANHIIGFGIFGTTEKDQLFDFGMHNAFGFILGDIDKMRMNIGVQHDAQIGTGNPNYGMHNLGLYLGGHRNF